MQGGKIKDICIFCRGCVFVYCRNVYGNIRNCSFDSMLVHIILCVFFWVGFVEIERVVSQFFSYASIRLTV